MRLHDDHASALQQAVMRFQELCVQQGLLADRDHRRRLSDKDRQALAAGRLVDPRAPRFATISGKGGWDKDPAVAARRARLRNVSLFDHVLSVGRGGAVIAVLTATNADPELEPPLIERVARLALALGLLHDIDKDLYLPRDAEIPLEQVAERVTRYRIDTFLAEVDHPVTPEQWRALIATVEDTQANRYRARIPGWADAVARAVRLADKLDGAFLEGTPVEGAAAVLQRLAQPAIRQQFPGLGDFAILHLRDPHHPFLLEELLRQLSAACERMIGLRPLVEICADGELLVLLPEQARDEVIEAGLERLARNLDRRLFAFSIEATNRQSTKLKGARPDVEKFCAACADGVASSALRPFLMVAKAQATAFVEAVGVALRGAGVPLAPGASPGQTVPILASLDDLSVAGKELLGRVLAARVLLGITEASARQTVKDLQGALLALVPDAGSRIAGLAKAEDRALALALLAAASCAEDARIATAFDDAIATALPGCTAGMADIGARILAEVRTRLARLLNGQALAIVPGQRHCLFTNEPVPSWMPDIEDADRLHGVKVSAFSGRSGRPEGLTLARGVTAVSPTSFVERKLQAAIHAQARDGSDGIPLLISSPASIGLFAALAFQNDELQAISSYELLAQDPRKAHVTVESVFERRYLLARFESMPSRLVDQLGLVDRLIRISLKLGRPLHVFSGLPGPRPEMFFMDVMPSVLANLIGGRGLRLEQMPKALEAIALARILTDKGKGLGADLLPLFAREATCLRAVAFAARQLRLRGRDGEAFPFEAIANDHLQGVRPVADVDKPFIRLGELAARVQRVPQGRPSRSDETLVFRVCLGTAAGLSRLGMGSCDEIAAGVVGRLDVELVENDKHAAATAREGDGITKALEELGQFFAQKVWLGPCKQRPPTNADRRLMEAVYVTALTRAWRLRSAARRAAPAIAQED